MVFVEYESFCTDQLENEESVTVSVMNGENGNRLEYIYIYCSKHKIQGAVRCSVREFQI